MLPGYQEQVVRKLNERKEYYNICYSNLNKEPKEMTVPKDRIPNMPKIQQINNTIPIQTYKYITI